MGIGHRTVSTFVREDEIRFGQLLAGMRDVAVEAFAYCDLARSIGAHDLREGRNLSDIEAKWKPAFRREFKSALLEQPRSPRIELLIELVIVLPAQDCDF